MTADDELKESLAALTTSIARLVDLLTMIAEREYNKEDESD